MDPESNPFAAFSFIVAPGLLTNASALMVLSTSNRLARAVDRARELASRLERNEPLSEQKTQYVLHELHVAQRRMVMLVVALRSVYVALASFASATLLSLIGAVTAPLQIEWLTVGFEVATVAAAVVAVGAIVNAAQLLARESHLVVRVFNLRASQLQIDLEQRYPTLNVHDTWPG